MIQIDCLEFLRITKIEREFFFIHLKESNVKSLLLSKRAKIDGKLIQKEKRKRKKRDPPKRTIQRIQIFH